MTTRDHQDLRRLVNEATPGPWTYGARWLCQKQEDGTYKYLAQVPLNDYDTTRWLADAAFIAAANPTTVLALLDEIEALRKGLEFYADPDTYVAIGFFGDRPCGDFIADVSKVTDDSGFTAERPGKLARTLLSSETPNE